MIPRKFKFKARYVLLIATVLLMAQGCQLAGGDADISSQSGLDSANVIRVIDGDTIELDNGEVIRYLGIDTPETVHPDKPVECYGPEAAERNKELVEEKTVELLADGPNRDTYGRLLRYVFVDGTFVNGDLVWGGYALARSYGDSPRLYQTLVQLERAAREANRGLWSTCPER